MRVSEASAADLLRSPTTVFRRRARRVLRCRPGSLARDGGLSFRPDLAGADGRPTSMRCGREAALRTGMGPRSRTYHRRRWPPPPPPPRHPRSAPLPREPHTPAVRPEPATRPRPARAPTPSPPPPTVSLPSVLADGVWPPVGPCPADISFDDVGPAPVNIDLCLAFPLPQPRRVGWTALLDPPAEDEPEAGRPPPFAACGSRA